MPRPLPGPDHESVEFRRSPAHAEMRAALAAHGFASYVAMTQAPMAAQRAFHEDWSARMRARAAVRDATPPRVRYAAARTDGKADHAAGVRALHAAGHSDATIAMALGISKSYAGILRQGLGLAANGPHARNRALEPKVRALVAEGYPDAAIAARLGTTANIVGHIRRDRKLARNGWGRVSPAEFARRAEALRLRDEERLEFSAIAERLGTTTSTAFRWVRIERARQWWHRQEAA